MATIQTLTHGEPNWDAKVNANFAALNDGLQKVGGVVTDFDGTNFTSEGLVLLNSNFRWNNGSGYSIRTFGSSKLVTLFINLSVSQQFHGSMMGDIVQVPHSVAPNSPMEGIAEARYMWGFYGNDRFKGTVLTLAVQDWKVGDHFIINTMYWK